jgi:hypothetical protein
MCTANHLEWEAGRLATAASAIDAAFSMSYTKDGDDVIGCALFNGVSPVQRVNFFGPGRHSSVSSRLAD